MHNKIYLIKLKYVFYSESSGSLLVWEHSNSRVYSFCANSCRLIKKKANTLHHKIIQVDN